MKKYSQYFIALVVSISLLTSCAPDNENTTSDDRDKFVGTWVCNDSSIIDGSNMVYSVTVSKIGDGSTIQINNFYKLGASTFVTAEISGSSIVVASQTDDDYTMNGSGFFSKEKFSVSYTAKLGSDIDEGIAVYE